MLAPIDHGSGNLLRGVNSGSVQPAPSLEYRVPTHAKAIAQRNLVPPVLLAIFAALVALALSIAAAQAASVPRKYAGIVVDAKSGKVLYEASADAARYPASVTKVMTLYVLFQELEAGNVSLDTKFNVSKYAASAVPTKLGLRAGSTITVENAIKALVTLSANDIARVVAENISGSESAFAKRMTATAKALGMAHTTYRNASGLPDSGQVTTVRDQAILGIAVYQHFPKYYEYFQTKSFSYGKRTYGNHNRLLGANGVDGIKTGYINASGFNLLTAARRDNRHIVVVGFGFDSSGARDAKVRELVKDYLPKGRKGGYLDVAMIPQPGRKGATVMVASTGPVPVIPMPYPSFRLAPVALTASAEAAVAPVPPQDPVTVASIDNGPVPVARPNDLSFDPGVQAAASMAGVPAEDDRPLDVIGAWLSDTFSLGAPPAALGETRPSAPLLPPVGIGGEGEPIDLMTSGGIGDTAPDIIEDQATPVALADVAPGGWVVQIGAAPSEVGARALIGDATAKVTGLNSFRPYIERAEKDGQVFFRARFDGFNGRDDASGLCNELKKAKLSCLAMQS